MAMLSTTKPLLYYLKVIIPLTSDYLNHDCFTNVLSTLCGETIKSMFLCAQA